MQVLPQVIGILALMVIWLLYRALTGNWNPWKLIEGADGRPSASKFQWFLWTAIIVFAYVAIYVARGLRGNLTPISEFPVNVLISMGFSVTTMVAAKGITTSYVASGRVSKIPVSERLKSSRLGNATGAATNTSQMGIVKNPPGPGDLAKDDDGDPDLSKVQMLAWTLIAVAVYFLSLGSVLEQISFLGFNAGQPLPGLPDIDGSLMVLMGLGQGAYLGKKLTTTTQARLTGLSVGSGTPGTEVVISGLSFGDQQDGSLITLDGNAFKATITAWSDNHITLTIPDKQPTGVGWPKDTGQRIVIGLIVNGQESANGLPFTVTVRT